MGMTGAIIVLIVLVALYMFAKLRRPPASPQSRSSESKPLDSTQEFHAVSIKLSGSACPAAHEQKGKRFLSSAAPKLPLSDCTSANCQCRFVHHKDRRTRDDRRNPFKQTFGGAVGSEFDADKREKEDRRKDSSDSMF